MSGQKPQQEDEDFPFTEEELRRVPTSASPFTEHFAPPPRYPGTETHEMKNLPFLDSGATRAPERTGRPAAAREEAFNFQFFAPKKNMRGYLITLVIILILIIAALAALAGVLGHQLHAAEHESHNTTLTATMTEQLQVTTVHPTTLLTLTRSFTSSTLVLTQTETQTATQTAFTASSPTLDTTPHATCSAVSVPNGGFDVKIWSNYINSEEEVLALAVALDRQCGGQIDITGWNATQINQTWAEANEGLWMSNNIFTFQLTEVVLSQSLQSIPQAIIDTGGPSNTPDCGESHLAGT
ncbi:hypothetical protein N431DRAFT_516806 [Stipitochalara longipes BDJ]|nr:hypothetical protein N431DRAFT_516806 [Stipitochalara longipes BDJ]